MLLRILLDQPLSVEILAVLTFFIICCYLFIRSSKPTHAREPISIPSRIPIIGHAVSLFLYGSDYYERIRTKTSLPIYTLKLFGHHIYLVNSPELVSAVDRSAQDFSFAPYLVQFAAKALHPSEDGVQKLSDNIHGTNSDPGLRIQSQRAMRESMAAGSGTLDTMNRDVLRQLFNLMDTEIPTLDSPVSLFHWVRNLVTVASTNAVYGPANPFLRKEVADGLWAFDKDLGLLALNCYPKITASKGYYGREAVIRGFVDYFQNQHQEDGSPLVKARHKANMAYDVSLEDVARFESSLTIALLVNTAPATFWTLFDVLSNPVLFLDVRQQLESCIRSDPSNDNPSSEKEAGRAVCVDVAQVLKECPLLKSLLEEVLRIRSTNASGRMVMRDVMLNDQYLLRANSTVLMPSVAVHNDASIWGSTVRDFDPYRFVKDKSSQNLRQPAYAYRAFGGGAALCPGRFLASLEILSILTILVLRYNVVPVDSKGRAVQWQEPRSRSHILTSILSPGKDVMVRIAEREIFRSTTWRFTLGEDEVF